MRTLKRDFEFEFGKNEEIFDWIEENLTKKYDKEELEDENSGLYEEIKKLNEEIEEQERETEKDLEAMQDIIDELEEKLKSPPLS